MTVNRRNQYFSHERFSFFPNIFFEKRCVFLKIFKRSNMVKLWERWNGFCSSPFSHRFNPWVFNLWNGQGTNVTSLRLPFKLSSWNLDFVVKLLKIFKKLSRSFFQNDARNSILCNELRATFGQLGSTQGLSAQTTYWLVSTQLELNKLIYLIIELFERIIHADAKSMLFYDIWKTFRQIIGFHDVVSLDSSWKIRHIPVESNYRLVNSRLKFVPKIKIFKTNIQTVFLRKSSISRLQWTIIVV